MHDGTHEGEPRNWSTKDLLAWLDDDEKWAGVTRSRLVQEVAGQLDIMYQEFVPRYPNKDPIVDVQVLMPWAAWVGDNSRKEVADLVAAFGPLFGGAERPQGQGPLKICFNSSFTPGEVLENRGRGLPLGRHPADDFRHNQCFVAISIDNSSGGGFILQDYLQQEAMALKVLGVWFLPPGGKLHPGYKVVCHNLHGHPLQALNGCMATVVASAGGNCIVELDEAGGGDTVPGLREEVPNWALLFVQGTNIKQGMSGTSRQEVADSIIAERAWTSWQPAMGNTVVLRGLRARPDLNGRFGQVVKVGQAAGGDAEGVRHAVRLVKAADPASEELVVSAKRGNMVPVEEPPPVVVIAYTIHTRQEAAAGKLERFMSTQMPLLSPLQVIHCTPREIKCWNRCVERDARFLAPVPAPVKKKLLGQLDPYQWKLGVLMPLKPGHVAPQIKKATEDLMAAATCRNCGKHGSKNQKLLWCARCNGVQYCSVDCQRADWNARHRQECTGPAGTGAGAASADGAGPSGHQPEAEDSEDSVLVPVTEAGPVGYIFHNMRSGKSYKANEQQPNVHGDKVFLVKVQNPVPNAMVAVLDPDNPMWYQEPLMVYDKAQAIQFHVNPKGSTARAHSKMAELLRTRGVRGKLCPAGRKIYLRARREAGNLRIMLQDLPPQQQNW